MYENIDLPFKVMPLYSQINNDILEIRVKIKSNYSKSISVKMVTAAIPVPKSTISVNPNSLVG